MNIIIGDFSANVGKGAVENIMGNYGLGTRNDRGDRLIQFFQETYNVIMNTYFKLPARRLYTYRWPAANNQKKIDYILDIYRIGENLYWANIPSDFNLLTAKIKVRMKKVPKQRYSVRVDTQKLKQENGRFTRRKTLNLTKTHCMSIDTM